MNPEIAIAPAHRDAHCYLCKDKAAISARPRDLDDPDIDVDGNQWYDFGLFSCWGCIRKVLTMLMSDPKLPEREADAADEDAIPVARLDEIEHKLDEAIEEMDK